MIAYLAQHLQTSWRWLYWYLGLVDSDQVQLGGSALSCGSSWLWSEAKLKDSSKPGEL